MRGLLRCTRRLETQLERHATVDVFPEAESLMLHELVPGYVDVLRLGSTAAVQKLISNEFRTGRAAEPVEAGERVDKALQALSMLNRRLSLLELMASEPKSDSTTNGIRVTVNSTLVPEQSSPKDGKFVYAYNVQIKNEAVDEPVQLVSREFHIVDEEGIIDEVHGKGVVGKQPVLGMGEHFEYTSACSLRHLKGTMRGSYTLVSQKSGRLLNAELKPFALCPPKASRPGGGSASSSSGTSAGGGGGGAREGSKGAKTSAMNSSSEK